MKTKPLAIPCLLIAGVLIALAVQTKFRALLFRSPVPPAAPSAADPAVAEFNQLAETYIRLVDLHSNTLAAKNDANQPAAAISNSENRADENLSDAEWLKQNPTSDPTIPDPDTLLPSFLEFAQRHPHSPLAFDALFLIVRRGGSEAADVQGQPWQTKEEALDLVWDDHSHDPRIVHLFELLGGSLASQKTEAFLKRATEPGPDRAVQAAANYHLARYYYTLARSHDRSAQIAARPQLTKFERQWKIIVNPYLAQFSIDQNKNADKIDELLATVVEEFADVPAAAWNCTGVGQLHVETIPSAPPKKYADLARTMLFEVNHIVPGQPAPEIVGTDAGGQTFRLSDYRGKVVLLTFSADWCSDCQKIYPIKRALVEKYRDQPFVVLSVNRDNSLEDLQASAAKGETTWRCWFDGRDGPLNRAWNIGGIPDVYLLDGEHIIQNVALARFTSQKEFERAIEPLLQKAAAQ